MVGTAYGSHTSLYPIRPWLVNLTVLRAMHTTSKRDVVSAATTQMRQITHVPNPPPNPPPARHRQPSMHVRPFLPTSWPVNGRDDSPVEVVDTCLPKGFNESFVSPEDGKEYLIVPAVGGADFDACDRQVSI